MTSPAVQFAIPDSSAAAFTAGELAVGPASTAVAAGTRNFARHFILAGGTYVIKLWAADVATLWVGTEGTSLRRIGIHSKSSVPTTFTVFAQAGIHRLDVTLLNLTTKVTGFALTIVKDGITVYASAASGWVWSTGAVVDSDIPSAGDMRLTYPVWSVTPNWAEGVTERLEWLTEVIPSEVGTEQRRSLRRYPRRSIEASFLRTGTARQRIDTFIVGVGLNRFLVPLWFEQLRTSAATSGTTLTWPTGTFSQREFVAGELALFQGADPGNYEIVTVSNVSGTTLTFMTAPVKSWPAGTRITPLRVARFESLPEQRMVTDRVSTTQIRFNLDEPDRYVAPSWGYCAPLWHYKLDWSQGVTIDNSRTTYTIDVETGKVDVTDPGGRSRVGAKGDLLLLGRSQVWSFRQFLAQARGKSQRFWWPSGTHDLEPVGVIGGVTLDVAATGYSTWLTQPQDAKLMIGVVFSDGRPAVYRRIQSVTGFDTFDRLTLTQALPAMSRASIKRIQFVMPARFDQDGFELHHITDNMRAVKASVVVRSSDIDGMPDIDCWVTSRPYPVDEYDELAVTATVTGGLLRGTVLPQILALDVTGTVTGGSLTTMVAYHPYDAGAEAIDVTGTVTGGTLTLAATYGSINAGTEAIDVMGTVTGGSLQALLISTTYGTEGIDVTGAVTGGTLQ